MAIIKELEEKENPSSDSDIAGMLDDLLEKKKIKSLDVNAQKNGTNNRSKVL